MFSKFLISLYNLPEISSLGKELKIHGKNGRRYAKKKFLPALMSKAALSDFFDVY
jgi:hypothetical protein